MTEDEAEQHQERLTYDARLVTLRERLWRLIDWFRREAPRLVAAQRVRFGDRGWAVRVATEVQTVVAGGDPAAVTRPLDDRTAVDAALFALEVLDEAVAILAGKYSVTPPIRFGAGADEAFLVRLARERKALSRYQAGSITSHLRFHALIPTRVRIRGMSFPIELVQSPPQLCRDAVERGAITVATTSFGDRARLEQDGDGPFTAVATSDQRRHDLLEAILRAAAEGVQVFVAPELTLPPADRDELLDQLRWGDGGKGPDLFVPGTFHEERAGRDGPRVVHRAMLVNHCGNTQLDHCKIALYGSFDASRGAPVENVAIGDTITALLTPLGIVAVAICKDLCDDRVHEIWEQLEPEWLLVPAYGPGADQHEAAAKKIARTSATVTILAHEPMHSIPDAIDPDPDRPRFAPAYTAYKVLFSDGVFSVAPVNDVN